MSEFHETTTSKDSKLTTTQQGKQYFEHESDKTHTRQDDDNKLYERNQGYDDSTGVSKQVHEQQLNDQGIKETIERDSQGRVHKEDQRRNLPADKEPEFHQEWKDVSKDTTEHTKV